MWLFRWYHLVYFRMLSGLFLVNYPILLSGGLRFVPWALLPAPEFFNWRWNQLMHSKHMFCYWAIAITYGRVK